MSKKSSFKDLTKNVNEINIGDYYNRLIYYKKAIKNLKKIDKNQCLVPVHKDKDGQVIEYMIDNNKLSLIKQIGSKSKYGVVYLTIENKSLYSFAVKLMPYNYNNKIEVRLVELLSELTRKDINPHFLLTYKAFYCNNNLELNTELPLLIKDNDYLITVNELVSGNLKDLIFSATNNPELLLNCVQQILLSILAFHHFTDGIYHHDCHYKNFLFHRIEAGGYFHYKIYDKDIYIENKGFLWMIWDFGLVGYKQEYRERRLNDYFRICGIIHQEVKGDIYKDVKEKLFEIYKFNKYYMTYFGSSDVLFFNNLLFNIDGLFQFTIPEGSKIVNKKPYIIK